MKRHAWCWCCVALLGGCSWDALAIRSQSPDDIAGDKPAESLRVVGDMAVSFGTHPLRIESVGLVSGLQGTGSDPGPSPQRAALIADMQTRGIPNPNSVLASNNNALVLVRGYLRPGIQKGDHFDIEVRIPERSETSSLRGGYLLETRLREMAVLNHQVHEGHVLGLAQGPVLVDPTADTKNDRVLLGRGRILGGGVALKSRPLGLVLKPDFRNVANSARIAAAISRRFHTFDRGVKVGVAKAKTDEFVELTLHPRYKDNITRYFQVIRGVVLRESDTERMERLASLKGRLLDPATSADAALQLEAIGPQAVDTLLAGIGDKDQEVRFYAAEALAYLDRQEAAPVLGEAARVHPAFRVFAMTALSTMNEFAAYEQLRQLLGSNSSETRYGAFRALWAMNAKDPLVLGEDLGGQFSYHVLDTPGPAMIHVTRSRRPEVVLFGHQQRLLTPLAVNAGNQIMVTSAGGEELTISRFAVGKADQKRIVSNRVDDVIRAIVELGGTYPDVVQAVQEAKAAGALESRFEVDALPEAGRTYERLAADEGPKGSSQDNGRAIGDAIESPVPDLYSSRPGQKVSDGGAPDPKTGGANDSEQEPAKKSPSLGRLFARMKGKS